MIISREKYDALLDELDREKKKNAELQKETRRLADAISANNESCRVGAWCTDCEHIRYDKSVITTDNCDPSILCFTTKYIEGEVMYCAKHLHELCPEHSKHKQPEPPEPPPAPPLKKPTF